MGTAPTEGRVARPERRWGCRRGIEIEIDNWNSITWMECDHSGCRIPVASVNFS